MPRLTIDNITFPLGAVVAIAATISVVHMLIAHPPGDTVLPDDTPRATVSAYYAGALAAWGAHINEAKLNAFYQHWSRIEGELALNHRHPWAGKYQTRDAVGTTLLIAPQTGVTLIHRTGEGAIGNVGLAEGEVRSEVDHLTLHYQQVEDVAEMSLPTQLYPVRWGTRHFLLTQDNLRDLVNALNSQTVFPDTLVGSFLTRTTDGDKAPVGVPVLPAPYNAQLLKTPVSGKVTATAAAGHYRVNVGTRDGVFAGMALYAAADPNVVLQVVQAGERESEVDNPAAGLAAVKVGLDVSSRQSIARS